MKKLCCLISGSLICIYLYAQAIPLGISKDKTISLIFPFDIRHVDRGTKEVLVQQVKDANNVLLVKALSEDLKETNLSVLTIDGSIYAFDVHYNSKPAITVVHLQVNRQQTIETYASGILDNPRTIKKLTAKKAGILFRIDGLYIKENVSYCQFMIKNNSNINYDVELIRFAFKDKKKMKRTAIQEIEIKPLYIAGKHHTVKAKSGNVVVVALDKFTIPDAKYFAIQLFEKNGGRHLLLKINNERIMHSIVLPDLR